MNKYKISSRKLLKLLEEVRGGGERADQREHRGQADRDDPEGERRPTFLNESTPLISVSEPPYMFSAVTETRPGAARISTIAPKP